MAIAVPSTANTAGYTSASSVTITKPSGLAVGNVLLAIIHGTGGTFTVTTPTGWTQGTPKDDGPSQQTVTYLYKVADSADVAATNFSFTLSASRNVGGGLFRITGTAFNTLVDSTDSDTTTNGSCDSFTGGVTPTNANSLLVMVIAGNAAQQNGSIGTYAVTTSNPSWSEAWQFEKNLTDGNNYMQGVAYAIRPETTGTGTYGASPGGYNSGSSDWIGYLITVNPAVGVTVTATAGTLVLNGGTSVIKTGVKVAMNAGHLILNGGTALIKRTADWVFKNKNSTNWNFKEKHD